MGAAPWTTEVVAHDLRPGGRSALMMRGPAGEEAAVEGVFLEVVTQERVAFTNALAAGWVPQEPFMVGIITFADETAADGSAATRYTGIARHWSAAAMEQHRAMGFEEGWSIVAEQLEQVARRLV